MSKLQVGAQLYSVRDRCTNEKDMLECMKAIKAMGYNTCQLSGHNQEIPAEAIRDMLQETKLKAVCTHITFQAMEEDFDEVVRKHQLWDCAYPGIGGLPAEFRTSEGYAVFAERANAVAKRFKDHGMTFIYHNHAFEFERFSDSGKTGMEILFDRFSADAQFELDMFWVQMGGANPIDWIKKVAGRMDVAHFKEMNGSARNVGVIAPIGAGNMDWAGIIAACDQIGVKYALVEQDNAVESNSLDCMKFSWNSLSKLNARF